MSDIKVQFGKRVKQLRIMREMTQQELAEAADISISFLGTIERGQKSPTIETVQRIADALDTTASDMMVFESTEQLADQRKKTQVRRLLAEYADRIEQIYED